MKNSKKSGFSLIEILVVLGIVGIFTSFITPKISNYMSVAKDTKVVSTLQNLRTASEIYYFTESEALGKGKLEGNLTETELDLLKPYISGGVKELAKNKDANGEIILEIGGSRATEEADVVYGGKIKFTFKAPDDEKSDGINIWIVPADETVGDYNIKGIKWTEL